MLSEEHCRNFLHFTIPRVVAVSRLVEDNTSNISMSSNRYVHVCGVCPLL